MAIKFEDDKDIDPKPSRKEVGGKTYVAEEPASETKPEVEGGLPFAKPIRPDKKPRKPLR